MTWARQLLCALRGHDSVLAFEGACMLMRCTSCGHESPGWRTGGRAPRRRYEGDPRKLALSGLRVVARRSA